MAESSGVVAESGGADRVHLAARRWVRLPGTAFEVLLHGRASGERVMLKRTYERPQCGGWDMSPVLRHAFIRRVEP